MFPIRKAVVLEIDLCIQVNVRKTCYEIAKAPRCKVCTVHSQLGTNGFTD